MTGAITVWSVNGSLFTLSSIFNGDLPYHSINGTNLVINVPFNNTEYACHGATARSTIQSEPAFLYIAGK